MNGDYAIVIPAHNPDDGLPGYVAALRTVCPHPILLVDDGSRADTKAAIRRCQETVPDVSVAVHETNRGKGRALKTAFARLLGDFPDLRGCVTCDCDGQHAPEDVAACLAALAAHPDAVILGCRSFGARHVPWKSRLGNNTMRLLFRLVTGRGFADTQTGLRALPADFMRELLDCPGERFEFETRMLLRLGGRPLVQVPIRTLYDDGNRGTHFRPFGDSAKILGVLLAGCAGTLGAFALASLLSFGVDIGLFTLLYYVLLGSLTRGRLFWAVLLARVASVLFNYACNRYFVFGETRKDRRFDARAFRRYVLLAVVIMGASYALTRLFGGLFPGTPLPWIKACVDFALFLSSFAVQRLAIFCPAPAP
jgi:glycosyltransferase involved in cell wall biosynthesis